MMQQTVVKMGVILVIVLVSIFAGSLVLSSVSKKEVPKENNTQEWHSVYTKIVENVMLQKDNSKIYFREIYTSDGCELDADNAGGVSDGYPINNSEFLYFLKDITSEPDGIPELFIGIKADDTKIAAIYTFDVNKHIAYAVSTISVEYNPEIRLCTTNLFLEKKPGNMHLVMLWQNGPKPFAAFRKEQDEGTLIDSSTLQWLLLEDWNANKY